MALSQEDLNSLSPARMQLLEEGLREGRSSAAAVWRPESGAAQVLHLGSCESCILTGTVSQVLQLLEALVQQLAGNPPARAADD
eukprot:gene3571-3839_t